MERCSAGKELEELGVQQLIGRFAVGGMVSILGGRRALLVLVRVLLLLLLLLLGLLVGLILLVILVLLLLLVLGIFLLIVLLFAEDR